MNRSLPQLVLAVALALQATPALAAPPPGGPRPPPVHQAITGKVTVDLMCVKASHDGNKVDPELQGIIQKLKNLNYSSFQLLDRHTTDIGQDEEKGFELDGGRKVKVTLLNADDTEAKVRIRLLKPNGTQEVDTTVSIKRDRTFIIAGPKLGEGVLILPVTVRY